MDFKKFGNFNKIRNGFKKSESGFDTNKTNPFLFISIHFRLLGKKTTASVSDEKNQ